MKVAAAAVLVVLALICFAFATCELLGCQLSQPAGTTTPAPLPVPPPHDAGAEDAGAVIKAVCEHLCTKGCTDWCGIDGQLDCEAGLQNLLDSESVRVDLDCLQTAMGCDTRSCVQ